MRPILCEVYLLGVTAVGGATAASPPARWFSLGAFEQLTKQRRIVA
jgi:hypothetical protein